MKTLLHSLTLTGAILFSAIIFSGCSINSYTTPTTYDYSYNNPDWAPRYETGVRYYYFPDIESYYDINSRNFIVLNNGQWIYVESISPYYSSYSLYDSYIVVVNVSVYQPWMHHQYYNSHYPRYYYRDYYDYSNIPYVRGFNENHKSAIYWDEKDRGRARSWDDRNLNSNRKFTYSEADRKVQESTTRSKNSGSTVNSRNNTSTTGRTENTDRNVNSNRNNSTTRTSTNNGTSTNTTRTNKDTNATTGNTRTNENTTRTGNTGTSTNREQNATTTDKRSDTNYYGKPIGRPVRVEKQMRESNTTRSTSTNTTGRSNNTNTDTNTTNSRSSNSDSKTTRSSNGSGTGRTN